MKLIVPLTVALSGLARAEDEEDRFELLNEKSQIKSLLNQNKCWELTDNNKIRMRNCDENKASQKWTTIPVYYENNNQEQKVKYQIQSQDNSNLCVASGTTPKGRKLNLVMESCVTDESSQCFKYENSMITHKRDGKQYCLIMSGVVGKFLKKAYCPSTGFGMFDDSYNPTRPPMTNCTNPAENLVQNEIETHTVGNQDSFILNGHNCNPSYEVSCDGTECVMSNHQLNCNVIEDNGAFCNNKDYATGDGNPLSIGFFNAHIFGDTKANREGVMNTFVKIFDNFDIVGVSEIKDANQSGPNKFFNDYLNVNDEWEKEYSARDGTYQGGSSEASTEQLVYFYRKAKVELVKTAHFDDFQDIFYARGPQVAHFRRIDTGGLLTDFTLVQMHLSYNSGAVQEVEALAQIRAVVTLGGQLIGQDSEGNSVGVGPVIDANDPNALFPSAIMFGGDMNADDPIILNPEQLTLQIDPSYKWMIDNDDDTNVASSTAKAFDRIIVHGEDMVNAVCDQDKSLVSESVGEHDHGVMRFEEYFNAVKADYLANNPAATASEIQDAGLKEVNQISDHWVVFAKIW